MMHWINYFQNAKQRLYDDRANENQYRSVFQMDYDRIIFSSAFRRLQNKTQVLPFPKSDYVRNRLTHSLETASVGRTLGNIVGGKIMELYPDLHDKLDIRSTDFGHLVSAACLAHDIGNPPFGHSGEAAISSYFNSEQAKIFLQDLTLKQIADLQHFEGNASGLRIISHTLENQSGIKGGLRLTLGLYATFTKYPKESLPDRKSEKKAALKKFGIYQSEIEMFENEIAAKLNLIPNHTGEGKAWRRFPLTFLVEAADDICYHIIDFEDGFNMGFVSFQTVEDRFMSLIDWKDDYQKRYDKIIDKREKINYLRSLAINSLVSETAQIFVAREKEIITGETDVPLLNLLPVEMKTNLDNIIAESVDKIYRSDPVLRIEMAGLKVIPDLLHQFISAAMHPDKHKQLYKILPQAYKSGETPYEKILNATMFISDMTDRQAVELYKNLNGIELAGY
jgi:dGTPase